MAKTFELTREERHILCNVLDHVMETNSNCNMEYEEVNHTYVWCTPEAEQEQDRLQALYDKLAPKVITRSGWVLKENLHATVCMEDVDKFQFVKWEERE